MVQKMSRGKLTGWLHSFQVESWVFSVGDSGGGVKDVVPLLSRSLREGRHDSGRYQMETGNLKIESVVIVVA